MKLKKIGLGILAVLALAVVGVLVAAALQPTHYTVTRSRVVSATPEEIQPMLTDLRQWNTWNPWIEQEPTAHLEYSDPASGEGAWYTWEGEVLGAGRMDVEAVSPQEVRYSIAFTAPMESDAIIRIHMEPEAQGTRVTWTMEGDNDFMGKLFGVFMDMDSMIGADFERGLANLDQRL
jgi:hypothetical protein